MARLKLAPPWAIYYNELKAMFENDPEIGIVYDSDNQKIIMYVDNAEKAEALETLLETNLEFGEAAWTLEIVPSNSVAKTEPDVVITCKSDIYKQKIAFDVAFSGNPEGSANLVDWLNKKMFAYRTIDGKDMFELGLALETPEGMYT